MSAIPQRAPKFRVTRSLGIGAWLDCRRGRTQRQRRNTAQAPRRRAVRQQEECSGLGYGSATHSTAWLLLSASRFSSPWQPALRAVSVAVGFRFFLIYLKPRLFPILVGASLRAVIFFPEFVSREERIRVRAYVVGREEPTLIVRRPGFLSRESAPGSHHSWLAIVHWGSAADADASMEGLSSEAIAAQFMSLIEPGSLRMKRYGRH
ncbi:hypothetical protein OKW41_004241 [Paraburkholderia sp. UCT70]